MTSGLRILMSQCGCRCPTVGSAGSAVAGRPAVISRRLTIRLGPLCRSSCAGALELLGIHTAKHAMFCTAVDVVGAPLEVEQGGIPPATERLLTVAARRNADSAQAVTLFIGAGDGTSVLQERLGGERRDGVSHPFRIGAVAHRIRIN